MDNQLQQTEQRNAHKEAEQSTADRNYIPICIHFESLHCDKFTAFKRYSQYGRCFGSEIHGNQY